MSITYSSIAKFFNGFFFRIDFFNSFFFRIDFRNGILSRIDFPSNILFCSNLINTTMIARVNIAIPRIKEIIGYCHVSDAIPNIVTIVNSSKETDIKPTKIIIIEILIINQNLTIYYKQIGLFKILVKKTTPP